MDIEDGKTEQYMMISINRSVLFQSLFIGVISAFITGFLLFYHTGSIVMYVISMIFGFTLGFLGIYLLFISKPLFIGSITLSNTDSEEDEDIEFHSTMRID